MERFRNLSFIQFLMTPPHCILDSIMALSADVTADLMENMSHLINWAYLNGGTMARITLNEFRTKALASYGAQRGADKPIDYPLLESAPDTRCVHPV